MTTNDEIKRMYNLLIPLKDDELVCSCILGSIIQNMTVYKFQPFKKGNLKQQLEKGKTYPIGKVGNKNINIDPYLTANETRIFDKSGNMLIDLKDHGFTNLFNLV